MQTVLGGDENDTAVGLAFDEARDGGAAPIASAKKPSLEEQAVVVLGSGNLGLIYLMEARRRLSLEEIEARHPRLVTALRTHPHVGFVLARSGKRGPVALGARGTRYLDEDRVEGEDPLGPFSANAATHPRARPARHPRPLVNSFYDPQLDEGCAFEELISFHGGMGGSQTQPFILAPVELPLPRPAIIGAVQVHAILSGWRAHLNHGA